MSNSKYCYSINKYKRFLTREVNIGDVNLGGNNPIRIQSMTTTDTLDVKSTINQSIRIIEAGSDYVRITAPSIKQAKALKEIKKGLKSKGYNTPLIADIHFTPKAAEVAAELIEKVRINPGNYADVKKFKSFEYTTQEYNDEIDRIYKRFTPLVKICKENGTAMRIGTNHGSLSDRIMNRYGDTPLGMVESAMEFLRICENHSFYNIVISMKASNTIVMVQAYRLLINKMIEENMNYPLHLGVTEAGEGVEGRVKSAVGIGTLLEDGLGDTIRVSLTEEPEYEIPVAKEIVDRYLDRPNQNESTVKVTQQINPFEFSKRKSFDILNIGNQNVPIVISDLSLKKNINIDLLSKIGYSYSKDRDKWILKDTATDYIYVGQNDIDFSLPHQLGVIVDFEKFEKYKNFDNFYVKMNFTQYCNNISNTKKFLYLYDSDLFNKELLELLKNDKNVIIILDSKNINGMVSLRKSIFNLIKENIHIPVILKKDFSNFDLNKLTLYSSIDFGGLLIDGLSDGIFISHNLLGNIKEINELSFKILQSTRSRITSTEFISCPSCGRTQFDLQETTAKIRSKTSHLKGLKIAVMGCIVNGPGEMADADYGYVGTGFELVSLYKKHDVVKRGLLAENALDELIKLIKDNNDWVEPQEDE